MTGEPKKAVHKYTSPSDRMTHSIMEREDLPDLEAKMKRDDGEDSVHVSYDDEDGVTLRSLKLPKEELDDYIELLKHFRDRIEKYEKAEMDGVYEQAQWEVINPSDKGFIYGEFKTVAVATILFGGPMYALQEYNPQGEEREMPITLHKWRDWFQDQFDQNIMECWKDVGTEALIKSLRSVHLNRERSSLNNYAAAAHKKADQLEEMDQEDLEEFFESIQEKEEERGDERNA